MTPIDLNLENTDPEPQAPIEPPLEACCTSGCYPCIFDVYTEELQQYRRDLAAWQARQTAKLLNTESNPTSTETPPQDPRCEL